MRRVQQCGICGTCRLTVGSSSPAVQPAAPVWRHVVTSCWQLLLRTVRLGALLGRWSRRARERSSWSVSGRGRADFSLRTRRVLFDPTRLIRETRRDREKEINNVTVPGCAVPSDVDADALWQKRTCRAPIMDQPVPRPSPSPLGPDPRRNLTSPNPKFVPNGGGQRRSKTPPPCVPLRDGAELTWAANPPGVCQTHRTRP